MRINANKGTRAISSSTTIIITTTTITTTITNITTNPYDFNQTTKSAKKLLAKKRATERRKKEVFHIKQNVFSNQRTFFTIQPRTLYMANYLFNAIEQYFHQFR